MGFENLLTSGMFSTKASNSAPWPAWHAANTRIATDMMIAMRVYPPVPFNARTANRDTWLPSGGGKDGQSSVLVKEGERVVFASWGSHRSRKAFGDDAYEFRPERWEGLKSDSLGYVPFNLGPRACVGRK